MKNVITLIVMIAIAIPVGVGLGEAFHWAGVIIAIPTGYIIGCGIRAIQESV